MARSANVLTALPNERSQLVGRDEELARLLRGTGDPRVLTITGPGGIGKTGLALAFAHRLAERDDRVAFVELADVGQGRDVIDVVADQLAVEVVVGASRYDGLVRLLSAAPTVLVVDNFEHLMDAAPELEALSAACPDLRVVVTSRRPLRLCDEDVVSLRPLAATGTGRSLIGPGVRLLLDRAGIKDLSAAELEFASLIVEGLGGLPLAIELAAFRVRSLGLRAVYELLVAELALDGFKDAAAESERHSSLRRCLEWSYRDLEDGARAVFRATGAFTGTFDLEALRAVVGDYRRAAVGLATLVEHSFIDRVLGDDDCLRYTSLAPVREFARELLAASPERVSIYENHYRWYSSVAAGIRDRFERTDAEAALVEFRREQPNVNAAIRYLMQNDRYAEAVGMACEGAKLAIELGREGRVNSWFRAAVRIAAGHSVPIPDEGRVWAAYGELLTHQPQTASGAKAGLEGVIEQARRDGAETAVLRGLERLSYSVMAHGDLRRGLAASREAAELAAELGLRWSQAQMSILHAMGLHVVGDIDGACRHGYEGLRIARELNAARLVVRVGLLFAPMPRTPEMDAEQVPSLRHCLDLARRCGSVVDEMYVVMQLAMRAGFVGRTETFELARNGLQLADQTRSHGGELVFTLALAGAAFERGDDDVAEALDAALRLEWAALVPVIPNAVLVEYDRIVDRRRACRPEREEALAPVVWADVVRVAREYAEQNLPIASGPVSPSRLTERERDVLREIAAGRTNKEIALVLGVRPKTVMHHCATIYRKLGVSGRAEAAATALRRGLLDRSA